MESIMNHPAQPISPSVPAPRRDSSIGGLLLESGEIIIVRAADEEVLERGWCDPLITNNPAYELENYQERSSQPKVSDISKGSADAVPILDRNHGEVA